MQKVLRLEGAWCLWSRKEGWSGWRTAGEGDRGFEVRLDSRTTRPCRSGGHAEHLELIIRNLEDIVGFLAREL